MSGVCVLYRNVSKVIKLYRSGVATPSNVGVWVKVGLYIWNVHFRIKCLREICQEFNPEGGGIYLRMGGGMYSRWSICPCGWGFLSLGVGVLYAVPYQPISCFL